MASPLGDATRGRKRSGDRPGRDTRPEACGCVKTEETTVGWEEQALDKGTEIDGSLDYLWVTHPDDERIRTRSSSAV